MLSYVQGRRTFLEAVPSHQTTLKKRGGVMAQEHVAPTGQAYYWYQDVIQQVPDYGKKVAHQLARLCGDDSQVVTTYRSLADAVGKTDKTGEVSYVQRGVRILIGSTWLSVETTGEKRGARTTFYLQAGEDTAYKKKWDSGFYEESSWRNSHVA